MSTTGNGSDAEYEIEDILGVRWSSRRKKLVYLIRWVDYSSDKDSWEPVENINAPHLLKKWEKQANAIKREHGVKVMRGPFARRSFPGMQEERSSDGDNLEDGHDESPRSKHHHKRPRILSPSTPAAIDEYIENKISENDVPERILGVTNIGNNVAYLVQFRGKTPDEARLIYSKALQKKYHQLIISYYEPKIRFSSIRFPSEGKHDQKPSTSKSREKAASISDSTNDDDP